MQLAIVKVDGKRSNKLLDTISPKNLLSAPADLVKKFYKGADPFDEYLTKKNSRVKQNAFQYLSDPQYSRKDTLFNALKEDMEFLLKDAKQNPQNYGEHIAGIGIGQYVKTLQNLQRHTFDLASFDKDDFKDICKRFKNKFDTNSPFAFVDIDVPNRLLHVTESIKTLTQTEKEYVGDNGKLTNFFTFISSKGLNDDGSKKITNGLNFSHEKKKNFNFNLHQEAKVLYDVIHEVTKRPKEEMEVFFKFGNDEYTLYSHSQLKGSQELSDLEKRYLQLYESSKEPQTQKTRERRGSISPAEMDGVINSRSTQNGDTRGKLSLLEQMKDEFSKTTSKTTDTPTSLKINNSALEIIEKDFETFSVARAKTKGTYVLVNKDKQVISDSCLEMKSPQKLDTKFGIATFVMAKKMIGEKERFGAIGFSGKNIIDFKEQSYSDVEEAIYQKLKKRKEDTKSEKKDSGENIEPKNTHIFESKKETPIDSLKVSEKSTLELMQEKIQQQELATMDSMRLAMENSFNDALSKKENYVKEFYDIVKKSRHIGDAVDRIKERYATQPFVLDVITAQVNIDLEATVLNKEIINVLDDRNKTLEEQIAQQNTLIAQRDDKITHLSKGIEEAELTLEKTITTFEEKFSQAEEAIAQKEEEFAEVLSKKEEELFIALTQTKDLVDKNEDLGTTVTELKTELTLEKKHSEEAIEHARDEYRLLLAQHKQLKEENTKKDTLIEKLIQENKDISIENGISRTNIQTLMSKNLSLEETIEELEKSRDEYISKLEAMLKPKEENKSEFSRKRQ